MYKCAYGDRTTNAQMMDRWDTKVNLIKLNTWADEVRVAIKGIGNFRMEVDPEYKAQRPALEEGMRRRLNFISKYALEKGAFQCDGWEADDQVVAWAYEVDKEGDGFVIAAIDKDILQYPGNHYNYGGSAKKPIPEDDRWVFTSPEEGYMRFCGQLLTGDNIDNITGIHKVGPVKAKKALADKTHNQMMQVVCDMYKSEFGDVWEKKLHANCNLIYMRRWLEDEFLYKEHLNDDWKK